MTPSFILTLVFSLLLSASANAAPAMQFGVPLDQALVYSGGESTNLRDYDPATTYSSGDKLVFSGLVSFDPRLNLTPDLADTWEVSDDGTVYTFHIRENAKFHDGKPVTAEDVIYSWERAASPELASDTVLTYLGDIVGVREMDAGQADHISGLKAIDDHTLQVTIDAPKPYFILKLTFPTALCGGQGKCGDWRRMGAHAQWHRSLPNEGMALQSNTLFTKPTRISISARLPSRMW